MQKDDYNKYVRDNLKNVLPKIELKILVINQKLAINNRIEKMEVRKAYITIKDYKEGLPHKLSPRLMNPSKSDIDNISKNLLDKINKILILNTNVNQRKNTTIIIDWFKYVAYKRLCSFI